MREVLAKDAAIAPLAERQHGVVSARQLVEAGLPKSAIRRRVEAGRLHRYHRGVYAVGHRRLGPLGQLWAAHLATGAAIAQVDAAYLWGCLRAPSGDVHVVTTGNQRSREGIRVHRSTTLAPEDVTMVEGLPVTTVARTLADLPDHLRNRAMREADYLRLLDRGEITALLGRHPAARKTLAAYELITATPAHRTNSAFEFDLLDIIDAHGLPQPLVNHDLHGRRRDFYWPDHRLVVETDGRQAHERARAFADDRRRDRELLVRHGISTIRFAWEDRPAEVAGTLRAALAHSVDQTVG